MSSEGGINWVVACVGGALTGAILFNLFQKIKADEPDTKTTITCGIITPNGPVPTIKIEGTNVEITDFGIIRMKEGLYVPTTNEVCVTENEK